MRPTSAEPQVMKVTLIGNLDRKQILEQIHSGERLPKIQFWVLGPFDATSGPYKSGIVGVVARSKPSTVNTWKYGDAKLKNVDISAAILIPDFTHKVGDPMSVSPLIIDVESQRLVPGTMAYKLEDDKLVFFEYPATLLENDFWQAKLLKEIAQFLPPEANAANYPIFAELVRYIARELGNSRENYQAFLKNLNSAITGAHIAPENISPILECIFNGQLVDHKGEPIRIVNDQHIHFELSLAPA